MSGWERRGWARTKFVRMAISLLLRLRHWPTEWSETAAQVRRADKIPTFDTRAFARVGAINRVATSAFHENSVGMGFINDEW